MAWTLDRSLRDPRRIPGPWRSPQFAARLDRVRIGLLPMGTLASLADGLAGRPWRLHRAPPPR